MFMVVRSASVQDLNAKIYQAMLSLNMRRAGIMQRALRTCKQHPLVASHGEVLYIMEKNKILSWALLFKCNDEHIIHLYTRHSHRGKGYGMKLATLARQKYSNLRGHYETLIYKRLGIKESNGDYEAQLPYN